MPAAGPMPASVALEALPVRRRRPGGLLSETPWIHERAPSTTSVADSRSPGCATCAAHASFTAKLMVMPSIRSGNGLVRDGDLAGALSAPRTTPVIGYCFACALAS